MPGSMQLQLAGMLSGSINPREFLVCSKNLIPVESKFFETRLTVLDQYNVRTENFLIAVIWCVNKVGALIFYFAL